MIDRNEAEYVYEAVAPVAAASGCVVCAHRHDYSCPVDDNGNNTCVASIRKDGQEVIFKKKENDMSEKQEVKVGDVWSCCDGENVTIHRVLGGRFAGSYVSDSDYIHAWSANVKDLCSSYTLIERDGKEVRELEDGGWYPVKVLSSSGVKLRMFYDGGFDIGDGDLIAPHTYDWIGQKINLEELK